MKIIKFVVVSWLLLRTRGSTEAKSNNHKFKVSKVCLEGSLIFIILFHLNLMVARIQIQGGKPRDLSQFIHKLIKNGDREFAFHS